MRYSLQQLADLLDAPLHGHTDAVITAVATDTRQVTQGSTALFFCLVGERHNGHQFIEQAIQKGINSFIVSEKAVIGQWPGKNFLLVPDVLQALQTLAQKHREQFSIPVIGITGSNGKTIVKEWLYQLLSPEYKVVKSPKSYNSQVGVPLSVLNMEASHTLAIFEAGISKPGEMDKLQRIIQPTIGIFTNIGPAHDSGFENREQKILEKLKLFSGAGKLIGNSDQPELFPVLAAQKHIISWGQNLQSTYPLTGVRHTGHATQLSILHYPLSIPFTDAASVENALQCIVLMLELGYDPEIIRQRIAQLRNLPMRLELKYGINNCMIVDDSYSADLLSLQIALDFLKQQETNKQKTLIISAFDESGLSDEAFIQKLVSILKEYHFTKLIGVGPLFLRHTEAFNHRVKEWYVYPDTETLMTHFHQLHFENEIILVKGARRFQFEQVTRELVGQTHATTMEINLNALVNNLNVYRAHLRPGTGVIAMVKAFSYGIGSVEVASLLETQRVDYLAVAYADEGVHLRRNGIRLPIMVMNPDAADFHRMREFQLEPELYSLSIVQQLADELGGDSIRVHLKVETGMNRLGFTEDDLEALITILKQHPNIEIVSVFSHLSGSEETLFDGFSREQIARFERHYDHIQAAFTYPLKKHLLNSSGIIRFPEAHYDYVRLGIGLYGVDSSETIQQQLQPVGRLKTRVAQVKTVRKGESVGYSRHGVMEQDGRIAVLALGYADGYDRRFGNGVGEVWINGHTAKVIGNICMDMCMVDVSHISQLEAGDEAEIFGRHISIITSAKKIGTIAYELLTGISPRVKRVYFLD